MNSGHAIQSPQDGDGVDGDAVASEDPPPNGYSRPVTVSPPSSGNTRRHRRPRGADARRLYIAHRAALPALPDRTWLEELERQGRILKRFYSINTPALWRSAAHVVVLVLSLAVFLLSRFPAILSAGPDTAHLDAGIRQHGGFDVTSLLIEAASAGTALSNPAMPATGAIAAGEPGFISPGAIVEADPELLPWDQPHRYRVKDGDTVKGIAEQFSIDEDTLLYVNPELRGNANHLSIGMEITVLPVDGTLHVVKSGETLDSIAKRYKTTADRILSYAPNGLEQPEDVVAGAEIVVPGGSMELAVPSYMDLLTKAQRSRPQARNAPTIPRGAGGAVGSGNFVAGAYGKITTRFTRRHLAIDIANRTGTPVYAVDGGVVTAAGWLGWEGNGIQIDHGNGYSSLYAHLSAMSVVSGQSVQRGQLIGNIGCTYGRGGRCTGPHLHLEIRHGSGNINPCSVGACP